MTFNKNQQTCNVTKVRRLQADRSNVVANTLICELYCDDKPTRDRVDQGPTELHCAGSLNVTSGVCVCVRARECVCVQAPDPMDICVITFLYYAV